MVVPARWVGTIRKGEDMQAVQVQPEDFRHGDVVAFGQRFYTVENLRRPRVRCGYALVMLRNMRDGTAGMYEFRRDLHVDVVRP